MKIGKLIILLSATAVFYSCGNEVHDVAEEGTPVPLSIEDASIQINTTRSATTLTTSGDAIGLFLSAGTVYSALDNVEYTYTTAWTAASTPIYLTKSTASLYAYYPYVDSATVTRTLAPTPYSATSDLCYKSGLSASATSSSLSFEMEHAYSKLTLNISKGAYTGTGLISLITFANVGLITSSTLDISSGSYTTGTTGGIYTDAAPAVSDLSTSATKQYLMVPCTLSGSTTLVLNVDGSNRIGSISNTDLPALVAGSNYTVNILLTGTSFVVSSVSTTDWVTGSSYSVEPVPWANCYIVAPSNAITIPVNVKGNGDATLVSLVGGSVFFTAASVGLLWQSSAGLVSVSGFDASAQTVTVTAGTGTGNAVIAAYDTDGSTILWSWHIWVTDYNPDTPSNGAVYTYNDRTWMDRNLGATDTTHATVTSLGLLYQWGRKDPFPGSASVSANTEPTIYNASGTGSTGMITKTAVSVSSNLANTILNPRTFYYGTSANLYDWYSVTASTHNNALWGGASTTTPTDKTLFDPCPAGWRVPAWSSGTSPWSGFSTTTFPWYNTSDWASSYGRVYTTASSTYYPAAGFRLYNSGALNYVGSYGYCWSASIASSSSYYLLFTSSSVYPSNGNSRAYGLAVRCIQEF